jgi:YD repeat-containing protein
LGQSLNYTYDADGQTLRTEIYDSQGKLIRSQSRQYDNRHRSTESAFEDSLDAQAAALTATFQWDSNGNLTQATDPNGNATQNSYDAADRLIESIDPLQGVIAYALDSVDRLTALTAPNGAKTEYDYDNNGRQTQELSPDRGQIDTQYDKNGNPTQQTQANGAKLSWTYDKLDRLQSETQTEADQSQTAVSYTYDNCQTGKLCQIDDGAEQTQFQYDGFGQLSEETHSQDGQAAATQYRYDSAGRISQQTTPSQRTISYQRDGLGRITNITATRNGRT